ncbi:MAG TPA: ATP-binding cassette domain-containing protein [Mycobacteriales bacterium]|nr:ATP-binding cassette domain-containing protein [Mycobacteriales bacterium]
MSSPAHSRSQTAQVWLVRVLAVPVIALAAELVFGWGHRRTELGFLPAPHGVPFGNLVEGAIFGLLFALPAFGLILVYRAQRIINFAASSLGGSAAVLGLLVIQQAHLPYLVGVVAALGAGGLLGMIAQRTLLRRFNNKSRLVLTVATIGVGQILAIGEVVLPSLFGSTVLGATQLTTPFSHWHFSVGQVVLSGDYIAIIVVALAVTVGLGLFFRLTRTGLGVRASADNADRASLLGIPVRRMAVLVWVIAGLLSAASAFLKIAVVGQSLGADIDPELLLFPLAAAVIANFDDIPTALIAGIGLGILDRAAFYSTNNAYLPAVLVLPIVLVALLGRRQASRAFDSGISSFQTFAESRPVPLQLRRVPEVMWSGRGLKVAAAVLAVLGPEIVGSSRLGDLEQVVIYAIVALSLTPLTGWAGQLSLGQFGIAGVGAAVAGGLATHAHADFFVTLFVAAAVGAIIATLIGIPALRLPGLFLAVVTLAFAAGVQYLVLDSRYFGWLLPGDTQSIDRPVLFGRWDTSATSFATDRVFYYLCLGILLLFIAAMVRLRSTRSGRVFIAQRDNIREAQALGVNAARTKIAAFAIAGAMAAVGGALLAYQVSAIDSTTFPMQLSIDVFVFATVGGIASPYGAVLGALAYESLNFFGGSLFGWLDHIRLGSLVSYMDELGLSSGVLLVLSFFPGGIASTGTALRDRYLRWVAGRRAIELPSLQADRAAAEHSAEAHRFHVDEPTEDALLVCRDLDVGYDGVQVLFGVDMHIRRGEILALLGTNGAGKSTLLRAISGLTMPSQGTITFDGRDITTLSPVTRARSGISQVPGGKGIFPTVTVADHFRAARWIRSKEHLAAGDQAQAKVLEWFPNLRNRWDTLAGNLSGGEAQQLAVGMAFITRPSLLIIDELSLGLAPTIVERLLDVVREVNEGGTTVVLVEQSVNVALTIAERAYFMEKGEVRFCGPTAELVERDDIVRSVFLAAANDGPATAKPRPSTTPPIKVRAEAKADVLRVTDLSVSFGGVRAVDSVSFSLAEGEILGLIGPNGAGKTTCFDLVSGFLRPTSGRVWFAGQDVTATGPDARGRLGLGRSFQDARIFPSLSVAENIAASLERHLEIHDHLAAALGMPDVADLERHIAWTVSDLVELLSLGAYRDKLVRELSTGTRRMVDIAMALAYDPVVLLLDEPSSGIAQRETEALGPMLLRIRDEADCSLLVIEHDMPLICAVSDRLLALEQGRVIAGGRPEDVLRDPQVVASYLGSNDATRNRSGSVPAAAAAT